MAGSALVHNEESSLLWYEEPAKSCPALQQCSQSRSSESETFPTFTVPYSDSFDKMIDKFQADLKSSLEKSLKTNLKKTLEKELAKVSAAKPT